MSKYCGYCDLQVEYCECGNVDHTKPREKPMSDFTDHLRGLAKMSDLVGMSVAFESAASIIDAYNDESKQNEQKIDSLTAEVERLREALNRVLKTSRGCSGRIILEEEDELDLIKALEGGSKATDN